MVLLSSRYYSVIIVSKFAIIKFITFALLSEISVFDADIKFFADRHHPDVRQWFFDDFEAWFQDPGNSRAYVLLGDPGVEKSVIGVALAKRINEKDWTVRCSLLLP